ncbi:FRG domain-containing protein [Rathayibacter toxicus]|uniref:FRG domain-containing protein n=1 Tax=Rathayibacter toxicus TaxID=145458 RepID=UPI001C045322|nr:FRG domain-containing protein [Rathayibacter toxicus]
MSAEAFFEPWEKSANSWTSSQAAIKNVLDLGTDRRDLAWRGVANSSYALHSSLYRRFMTANGVPPDEDDLVRFENNLLLAARKQWRFDNMGALEVMAHLQHYGGPTRLLDVSFNPLVALWFAVEQKYDRGGTKIPDKHGRLFVFDVTNRQIDLDQRWGGYALPWNTHPSENWRQGLPMLWRPPSYNDRIPAQNSAFLVGGVPQVSSGQNAKYRKAPGDGSAAGNWTIDEVRRSTSVTVSMNSQDRRLQSGSKPTFTLRIEAEGKPEIRRVLENSYGFNASSIYPDLFGLARYGADGISL